ncbi:hypothetical protein BX285_0613 [Streptomyces sp. 1114.5]|nr:hypothetical protein BX285_0613 [Streptomyces sp. 1114.5]
MVGGERLERGTTVESDTAGAADNVDQVTADTEGTEPTQGTGQVADDVDDAGRDGARRKDRAGLQLAAAVVLVAGVMAGLWGMGLLGTPPAEDEKPVACDAARPTDRPGYPALCAALNRPDLPALLGTPEDRVTTAHPAPIVFGNDVMVEVRLKSTVATLMDSNTSVEDMLGMPQFFAKPATVLGHPAATYWSNAMPLIPGPDAKAGPATRNLVVAQDPKAPGGRAYEFVVFRQDGRSPDEAALNRLAETILPTLPGWIPAP